MNTSEPRRVVLGVDGSLAGLQALRAAVSEAHRGRVLYAVRVWSRPMVAGPMVPAVLGGDSFADEARAYLRRTFDDALGGVPAGIRVYFVTAEGVPGPTLVRLADRDDDLLVVGTGGRSLVNRLVSGSVSRYCLAHARCPVLSVPAHALARELGRHRLLRRPGWSDVLTPAGDDLRRHGEVL